ncbi:hypothetical protein AB3N04_01625 [Alkalihalophilus sp. As8PL]|uniref:Uncharacterized protein n=1 Tax=Alkalihalophilus sp. As8PL TaxID=3237103 RepID=A0AB39BU70_9BACI
MKGIIEQVINQLESEGKERIKLTPKDICEKLNEYEVPFIGFKG